MSTRRAVRLSPGDQETEETRLLEQVRLLTLENETLRNFITEKGLTGAPPPKLINGNKEPKRRRGSVSAVVPNVPTDPGTPKSGARGCSCKGNCSTRVCGCVKKNIPCAEFCRCGDELCQNSEPDKENIGDGNNQPELSKDAADSLAKLSKLTLGENKGMKLNHPAFEPVNKQLEQVAKPRSLFSPDVADNVFQFDKTGDIEFENISLRFGNDREAEPAEAAGKAGESSEAKAAPGKKSKKDEKKQKDAAGPAAQDKKGKSKKVRGPSASDPEEEENIAEAAVAGKKGNKKTETKKGKAEAAPVTGDKKKQASKARARIVNNSESEAEDKTESEEEEEAAVQEPVKEKSRGKTNNKKKEAKKGKTVTAPAQSDKRQEAKGRSRIRDNSGESEDDDEMDNEREDEKSPEERVEKKSREERKTAKKGKPSAAPEKSVKMKGGRARIVSMETDEEEQEEEQESTAPIKNYKKILNREESSEDSEDDDDFVEPEPVNKKNNKEGTRGKKLTSVEEQNNDEESDGLSEDTDENAEQDPSEKNNNNNASAGASDERMEDDGESEQSEYNVTSSTASDSLNPGAADDFNPMKPRRQLMRSPLNKKIDAHIRPPQDPLEIPLRGPLKEELPEALPEPEELNQVVVENWDEHKANLVECSKCGRKLFPHRIEKHEAFCKKI